MLSSLDELRKKPQHVKSRYAFVVAFLITAVIAGVWANVTITALTPQQIVVQKDVDSSLSRMVADFREYLKATIVAFKPEIEYTQEKPGIYPTKRIDLKALVASSTAATLEPYQGSSTATSTTHTSTSTNIR
jgi:hypothetical protein